MKSLKHKPLLIFLGLTLILSTLFYIPILNPEIGMQPLLILGLMWSPGLSAILTSLICYKSIKGLGWRWGKTRWQLFSYFLPFVYAGVVYVFVWLFGLGILDRSTLSSMATVPSIINLIALATIGTGISALGEEIGWRGFLVPEMAKDLGWIRISLYSGAIWALWHTPLILFSDYHSNTPVWFGWSCFTVMVIGTSFAYTWIRLKSGSLWTGVLLHGGHNFIIQGMLDPLTINTGNTFYYTTEFGSGLAVAGIIVAIIFWKLGDPRKNNA